MSTHLLSIVYGLSSAVVWGTGDFTGGLAAKRLDVTYVVLLAHFIGLILYAGLALFLREPIPDMLDLFYGAVAGLAGMLGLLALYKGLAESQMGITAPLAAVVTAIIPIIVGMMTEGLPTMLQIAGFGTGMVAVWFLAGSEEGRGLRWQDLVLPVIAGIGFALFLILIDRVKTGALFWPLTAARAASVLFLFSLFLAGMPRTRSAKGLLTASVLPLVILSGIFDAGGNAFAMLAAQTGRLDVASLLSSLYPASTMLLAWLIMGERLTTLQRIGAALALIAVALITL